MPVYNKLFSLLANNDGFGEITTREGTNNKKSNSENIRNLNTDTSSNSNSSNTAESKNSELPQSQLNNLRDESYVSNFDIQKSDSDSNDSSNSKSTENSNMNSNDDENYRETTSHFNMLDIYTQMKSNLFNIYDMIFNDLNDLFYAFE